MGAGGEAADGVDGVFIANVGIDAGNFLWVPKAEGAVNVYGDDRRFFGD